MNEYHGENFDYFEGWVVISYRIDNESLQEEITESQKEETISMSVYEFFKSFIKRIVEF